MVMVSALPPPPLIEYWKFYDFMGIILKSLPCHLKSDLLPKFPPAAGSVNQILLPNRVPAIRNQAECQNFRLQRACLGASAILKIFANTETKKVKKKSAICKLGFETLNIFFLSRR